MTQKDAGIFLKLIFYVCLSALISISIWEVRLFQKFFILPIIPVFIVSITFALSYITCQLLRLEPPTRGTFFVGTMVMNIGFIYPIGQGLYGTEGISQVAIYDIGQGLMAFVFAYSLACKYGELVSAIFIRMIVGSLLGIRLTQLFGVQGVTRIIAIICSAAPAGHSTLTFSSLKNLDVDFAASLVPVSVFCGLVYIPILLYVL